MSTPIPDAFAATLRTDATAALGALMVIAHAHAELFSWAARMASTNAQPSAAAPARVEPPPRTQVNGVESRAAPPLAKASEHKSAKRRPKGNGTAAYLASRREARDRDDEKLIEAMRDSPESSIGDWAATVGKSRTSVVAGLHRLRDVGLAESVGGQWRLTEEPAPREPPPKWIRPISGNDKPSHAHLTAC
jgi:hypothetical protein